MKIVCMKFPFMVERVASVGCPHWSCLSCAGFATLSEAEDEVWFCTRHSRGLKCKGLECARAGGAPACERSWEELDHDERGHAACLGFDACSWDEDDWSNVCVEWGQLHGVKLVAAKALLFEPRTWHGRVRTPPPTNSFPVAVADNGTLVDGILFRSFSTEGAMRSRLAGNDI